MSLLNENLLDQSDFVQDVYITQTKTFSSIEYPYLIDIIKEHNVTSILDVGAGEGNFISGLAQLTPDVNYIAVEGDKKLVDKAKEKNAQGNITFVNALFDETFSNSSYDMILARFAVEHMTDISQFVSEAMKRLKPGGVLLITEYYCEFSDNDNEIWKLFRKKEIEMYVELASKPKTSIIIPKRLKDAGFSNISSIFRHLTPTTIGHDNFYKTVISYVIAYNKMAPEIFTEKIKKEILDYCIKGQPESPDSEDRLFLTHTFGINA